MCLCGSHGKSLCYQLLPFVFNHRRGSGKSAVLVGSPLMVDQVQRSNIRHRIISTYQFSHSMVKGAISCNQVCMQSVLGSLLGAAAERAAHAA